MRILLLHADTFAYRVTGETAVTKQLDPIPEEVMTGNCGDSLVCMIAVERSDGDAANAVVEQTAVEIANRAADVNTRTVMLYPYAHLSSELETPRTAVSLLEALETRLQQGEGLEVKRAPFGVYKGFDISVKGHPLSELARTITVTGEQQEQVSDALAAEDTIKSEWFFIMPEGDIIPADDFNLKKHPNMKTFFAHEVSGTREAPAEPPHVKLMQEHELVDYEPGSDQGNFRWYPKGYVIKKLMEDHINAMLADYGAMQVETPLMYDIEHPALSKYLNKFPARQYSLRSEKRKFFLRFAACFGQYLIKHDMQISYRHLPIRMYELTHHSFRREQSGELSGLRRLRTFTMPDMHTLCADIPQAKEEMLNQVDLSYRWMADLGFDYEVAVRAVRDFFFEDPSYAKEIARRTGKPVLLELWDKRYFYFITKFECNVVDSQGKAAALSTVQIDVENPAGFGINYIDADDNRVAPMMLHTSVSGSIDRNLYGLLEQQSIKMKKSQKGQFPFWLAPTQIRLISVGEAHVPHCIRLMEQLSGRVDVDDRNEKLGKKIRSAEREWIPLIIVIGDKEAESETFPVRSRETGKEEPMTLDQIRDYFDTRMTGKAYRPINLPRLLSKRPTFRG